MIKPDVTKPGVIKHGGNINEAAIHFGIAVDQWLDLSTGLNPGAWQLDSAIPEPYYQKLPHADATFYSIASRYYKTGSLLAVPGSQAAIQTIPRILKNKKVALPVPGYEEHFYHWQQNQHTCLAYDPDNINLAEWVAEHKPDVVVVINPNNPSCCLHKKQSLLDVLALLEKNDGLLIVDEAFIDTRPEFSLLNINSDSLIVLRSLGKFFGLPGIRVGFVKAAQKWRDQIESHLGVWAMNGPGLYVAGQCLTDFSWQQQAAQQLKQKSAQQMRFLEETLSTSLYGKAATQRLTSSDFFMSYRVSLDLAGYIHDFYGQRGILVRLVELSQADLAYEAIIRIGLCPDNRFQHFQVVTQALAESLLVQQGRIG